MARLYISAHQDDDLIFMSPCLSEDVASGEGVWTIYLTAGDAGIADASYWRGREDGERAAYSVMGALGWKDEVMRVAKREIASSVSADGKTRLVFLRIPDGGSLSNEQARSKALERIWEGAEVGTIDGAHKYTSEELLKTLIEINRLAEADLVSTHDPDGWVAGCDHLDHLYTGRFAVEAAKRTGSHLMLFRGYSCDLKPPNLPDVTYFRKRAVFEAYARHDSMIPSPLDALHEGWLKRSYSRIIPSEL
jgi:LmbE family N-acetylglucosaminyl deacetylase